MGGKRAAVEQRIGPRGLGRALGKGEEDGPRCWAHGGKKQGGEGWAGFRGWAGNWVWVSFFSFPFFFFN